MRSPVSFGCVGSGETYEKCIWINPVPEDEWEYTQSIAITRQLMEGKMFPLTLRGLEEGMSFLSK